MSQLQVVLRELAVDGPAALPVRSRLAAAPAVSKLEVALQAAQQEGLRQGHEKGLRAGYEEGLRVGRAEAEAEAHIRAGALEAQAAADREMRGAALRTAVAEFESATREWLALAEEDIVALCYETLGRILAAEAIAAPIVRAQAAQLLEQWHGLGVPSLHVHPADLQLLEGLPAARAYVCVADPELQYGGFIVRGEGGALDARLDRILEEVKAALIAARNQRPLPESAA
jgi:flagellar assembly protein FliH